MNEMLTLAPKASAPNPNSIFPSDAGLLLTSTLSHWSIENAVHWVLVEDDSRTGHGHAQHKLAVLSRLALGLLCRQKSAKTGSAAKHKRAGWTIDYFLRTLSQ